MSLASQPFSGQPPTLGRATPIPHNRPTLPSPTTTVASCGSSGPMGRGGMSGVSGLSGSGDSTVEELLLEHLVDGVMGPGEILRLNRLARELTAFSSFAKLVLFTTDDMQWRPYLVASRGASEQNKADHLHLADAYDMMQERRGDPRRARRSLLGESSALPATKLPEGQWGKRPRIGGAA